MQVINKNEDFNLITMTPYSKEDKKSFIYFRSSHVIKVWKIFIAYMTLINLIQVYKFINDPTDGQRKIATAYSCASVVNLLVLVIGSRFKRYMVYIIVFSFLTQEFFNVVIARETLKTELASDCANNALYRFDYHFMFFAMFLCPTTKYLVFWFVPIYAIKYNMVVFGTEIDIWFRISQVLTVVLNVFILFYIVTWRELVRFFQ